ncbi:MAG: hypothetical protein JF617_18905, partial [Burkholderiales bacterium]|nr:hypothetical protein [Burkholderiales bacterium]
MASFNENWMNWSKPTKPIWLAEALSAVNLVPTTRLAAGFAHLHVGDLDAQRALDGEAGVVALLEGEVAVDVDELADGQARIRQAGTDDAAGHIQHDGRAAGGHIEAAAAAGREVDGPGHAGGRVQLDVDAVGRQLEVVGVEAVDADGVGMGLQRRVLDATRVGHQQADVHALHAQAVEMAGLVLEAARA